MTDSTDLPRCFVGQDGDGYYLITIWTHEGTTQATIARRKYVGDLWGPPIKAIPV